MLGRVGLAAVILFGTLFLAPAPAAAQGCSLNADCSAGDTCVPKFGILWFWKECRFTLCNVDTNCTGGTLCLNGRCQVGCRTNSDCASNNCVNSECKVKGGPVTSVPGEGRKCMPKDGSRPPGWATDANGKPLGACPKGTSCSDKGFCRKLEQ